MANIRLYINTGKSDLAIVQYQISYLGKQKKGSTKHIKVPREAWSAKEQTVKGNRVTNDLKEIRNRLINLKDFAEGGLLKEFEQRHQRQPKFLEYVKWIDRWLHGEAEEVVNITSLLELIDRFKNEVKDKSEAYHNKTDQIRANLSIDSEDGFIPWVRGFKQEIVTLEIAEYDVHFVKRYAEYLAKVRGYANHSIEGHLKRLTAIISKFKTSALELSERKRQQFQRLLIGLPEISPAKVLKGLGYPLVNEKLSETPYPSTSEIQELYDFDCKDSDGNYRTDWEKTRDCFIASCLTGARYGELHDRSKIDVQPRTIMKDGQSKTVYVLINSDFKTKSSLNAVPCPDMLLEIIDKWSEREFTVSRLRNVKKENGLSVRERIEHEGALFPVLSNPVMNRCLHEILFEIGLRQMSAYYGKKITKENYQTLDPIGFMKAGKMVHYCGTERKERTRRRYEVITFHKARHAFGNYLLELGYPMKVVSLLLNHKKVSTTELWYADIKVNDRIRDVVEKQNAIFKPSKRSA